MDAERQPADRSTRGLGLVDQTPGLVVATSGPDHVVRYVNHAHRRLFDSAGWIGQPLRDVLPVADPGFFRRLDEVYATGETTATGVDVRLGQTETTRHLTVVVAPWIDDDGRIAGILCDAFDDTRTHLAWEAMRASEDRLRRATEAARIGTWDFDPVSGALRWDTRCKALFGLPPDAGITYDGAFLAGLHPDDRARTHAAVQDALAPGGTGSYDIEYRTIGIEDGIERWIAATGNTIFDGDRAVRFVGTVRDITPRQRANRRLEIVARTGAAVAAELDLGRIVQMVTDAGVELTGAQFGAFFYNVEAPDGERYMLYTLSGAPRSAFESFPMPRNTAVFAPTFTGDGPVRSDDILADPRYGRSAPHRGMPKGHLPVRSYLAVPVVSRSGKVHGGLFFGHAETGVFEAEHEGLLQGIAGQAATAIDNARLVQDLQSLNATLEQRVAAEVADRLKAEELLRQSQKLEAIGQLTGGISHDFNNLLMVVSGGLGLIEKSDDPARRAMLAARVREAVSRGTTLVQHLLAFSRKTDLKPEVVAFAAFLGGMSDLLDRSLGGDVRVEIDTPGDLAPIYVDQTALQLALLNLAVNARDAMPGGGTIVIRARNGERGDPSASTVSISVIDPGTGMSPETQSHMFEPFFTTKEVGKGSGLGLAQVHGFAQQSGGRVDVDSAPGRGTTITLVLPRSDAAAAAAPPAESGPPPRSDRPGRVLLVEDDPKVAATASDMLEQLGWRVAWADSAEAALDAIGDDAGPDLVLSDVMMPGGMSGLDLARRLRARRPRLPVLLTSGYSAPIQRDAAAAGLPLLPKPFDLEALAAAVEAARAAAEP